MLEMVAKIAPLSWKGKVEPAKAQPYCAVAWGELFVSGDFNPGEAPGYPGQRLFGEIERGNRYVRNKVTTDACHLASDGCFNQLCMQGLVPKQAAQGCPAEMEGEHFAFGDGHCLRLDKSIKTCGQRRNPLVLVHARQPGAFRQPLLECGFFALLCIALRVRKIAAKLRYSGLELQTLPIQRFGAIVCQIDRWNIQRLT